MLVAKKGNSAYYSILIEVILILFGETLAIQPRPTYKCSNELTFSLKTSGSSNGISSVTSDDIFVNDYDYVFQSTNKAGAIGILTCTGDRKVNIKFEGTLVNPIKFGIVWSEPNWNYAGNDSQVGKTCYSAQVEISLGTPPATGKYTCYTVVDEDDRQEISAHVFSNTDKPPFLLLGDVARPLIKIKDNNTVRLNGSDYLVIPCTVSRSDDKVHLYKIDNGEFILQTQGPHLLYDLTLGFLLHSEKHPEPHGRFKCVPVIDPGYSVVIDVEPNYVGSSSPQSSFEISVIKDEAVGKEWIVCTSTSAEVEVKSTTDCSSPLQCQFLKKCLQEDALCHEGCRCSIIGSQCSKTLNNSVPAEAHLGPGCSYVGANENAGVILCKAGISFEYFTYFRDLNNEIVFDGKNVESSSLLKLTVPYNDTVYFVGESVKARCDANAFGLAHDLEYFFQYVNGTLVQAPILESTSFVETYKTRLTAQLVISDPEIDKLVCSVSKRNSYSHYHSSVDLRILNSTAPYFENPGNETVRYVLNSQNQSLECVAMGFPQPDILWLRNGDVFITDFFFDHSVENVSISRIIFNQITKLDDDTLYTCNASNPRGMIFKNFKVYVKEPASVLVISLSCLGIAICVAIVGALFIWKKSKFKPGYIINFSAADLSEFENGNPVEASKHQDIYEKALFLPYNKKYEIDPEDLAIDFDAILGQGEFGIVLEGTLKKEGKETPVAVKTLKGCGTHQLKALITELKIMIYMGQHENVVSLLGAVTKHLADRTIHVVVEHCELGSLEKYLRSHRGSFLDEFTEAEFGCLTDNRIVSYVRIEYVVKTSDLIRWSEQIANGMEYLASKKVVHGDLASRNVLLDQNQRIKITDFGLSKNLYKHKNNYVSSKKDVRLPWRWSSIETLRDQTFSTESDVWAYGITLWELFSLAETPYHGIAYGAEFFKLLASGHRLERPRYANALIYTVMRECWRGEPKERPTFTELKNRFSEISTLPDLFPYKGSKLDDIPTAEIFTGNCKQNYIIAGGEDFRPYVYT